MYLLKLITFFTIFYKLIFIISIMYPEIRSDNGFQQQQQQQQLQQQQQQQQRTSVRNYVQTPYDITSSKPMKLLMNKKDIAEKKQSRASPGVGYHEFLINEGSYKFWAIFQLVTVVVLLYSTFAAIYYARYNYLMNLENGQYDDLLFARSSSNFVHNSTLLDSQSFQRIVDSIYANR